MSPVFACVFLEKHIAFGIEHDEVWDATGGMLAQGRATRLVEIDGEEVHFAPVHVLGHRAGAAVAAHKNELKLRVCFDHLIVKTREIGCELATGWTPVGRVVDGNVFFAIQGICVDGLKALTRTLNEAGSQLALKICMGQSGDKEGTRAKEEFEDGRILHMIYRSVA